MGFPCRDIALYVATVGQGNASEPGCVRVTKTLCQDTMALCCVATEKVMRVQQIRLGAHDNAGEPRLGAYDRGKIKNKNKNKRTP